MRHRKCFSYLNEESRCCCAITSLAPMKARGRSCRCSRHYGRLAQEAAARKPQCGYLAILVVFLVCMSSTVVDASRHRPLVVYGPTHETKNHLTLKLLQPSSTPASSSSTFSRLTTAAAAAVANSAATIGRSLKQIGYDPYGYGYYDPYVAGVSPGFVNVDVNRETGVHVGVGDVVVDVSADKNYVGFGVGQKVGFGAARDRGWNLQLKNGNLLDASVTKDAGLGLWVLDGLLNINIGPEGIFRNAKGSGGGGGGIGAKSTDAATPVEVTSVTVDDPPVQTAAVQQQQQPTSVNGVPEVVVEDPAAVVAQQQQILQQHLQQQDSAGTVEVNPAVESTDGAEVNQVQLADSSYPSYTSAAAQQQSSEALLPSYDFMSMLAYDPSDATAATDDTAAHARLAANTQQSVYTTQAAAATSAGSQGPAVQQQAYPYALQSVANQGPAATAAQVPTAAATAIEGRGPAAQPTAASQYPQSAYSSYMVSRPAAAAEEEQQQEDAQWSVASQYSDTQQVGTAQPAAHGLLTQTSPALSAQAEEEVHANVYQYQQQQQQQQLEFQGVTDESGLVPSGSRRACDGGVQVWVSGNKFKCRYRKPDTAAVPAAGPVKVTSGQYTYPNGVAV